MWISYVYIYPLSFEGEVLPFQLPTEHWVEFSMLYNGFSLMMCFLHRISNIHMSNAISHSFPPTSPFVYIHFFFKSVFLFLLCKYGHLYHFSRFHIYTLTWYLFSFWLTLLHMTIYPYHLYSCNCTTVTITLYNSVLFEWLNNIPLCVCVYIHTCIYHIFFIHSSVDEHLVTSMSWLL